VGDSEIIAAGRSWHDMESSSGSRRISTTLAMRVKMCRSNGSRLAGRLGGVGRGPEWAGCFEPLRQELSVWGRKVEQETLQRRLYKVVLAAASGAVAPA
jgi:hypothetical protein